jgi:hypothetical protein
LVPNNNGAINHIGNAVVLSHGTVGVLAATVFRPRATGGDARTLLCYVSSHDGGNHFRWDTISAFRFAPQFTFSGMVPSLAVDRGIGPYRDRLYVAWMDFSSGRGQIVFSYSANEGRKWSKPIVISEGTPSGADANPGEFTPTVAVNPEGVVGITWYDRREQGIGYGSRLRFAASLNGGASFLRSVAVSEQASRPAPPSAPFSTRGSSEPERWRFIGGDTAGLIATSDGVFHAVWVDNRTGVSQVWAAGVIVHLPNKPSLLHKPLL